MNFPKLKFIVFIPVLITCFTLSKVSESSSVTEPATSVPVTTEPTPNTTTTEPPKNTTCETHNDCKSCVSNSTCYFCDTDEKCRAKITKVISNDECEMKKVHYLTCKANLQYLLIGIGVASAIALIIILACVCYCCCRRKKSTKPSKDDLKWARQREERKQAAAEKRKERAERTMEIRQKYGLVKDSNPYEKFDA